MTPAPTRPAGAAVRTVGRLVGLLATAVLLGVLGAAPAAAHNALAGSDPADGAALCQTPSAVVLTFEEPAVALSTQVVVTGPDGPVGLGEPQLVDAEVRQPLAGGAPAGRYTVTWRVASADGHPIYGQLSFTTEAAGAARPDVPAAAPLAPAETSSAWGWLVLAALLLAGAGTVAVLVRRRV